MENIEKKILALLETNENLIEKENSKFLRELIKWFIRRCVRADSNSIQRVHYEHKEVISVVDEFFAEIVLTIPRNDSRPKLEFNLYCDEEDFEKEFNPIRRSREFDLEFDIDFLGAEKEEVYKKAMGEKVAQEANNNSGEALTTCSCKACDVKNGSELSQRQTEKLIKVKFDGKWGFMDEKGKIVVECKYDWIDNFQSNGLVGVELNGRWGLINKKGEEFFGRECGNTFEFQSNGLVKVKSKDKWGLDRYNGETVVECKYDWINGFQPNGLARVKLNNKWGLINEKGEKVAECKYDWINDFRPNGLASVKLNDKWGFVNEKGEEVIECKYDEICL